MVDFNAILLFPLFYQQKRLIQTNFIEKSLFWKNEVYSRGLKHVACDVISKFKIVPVRKMPSNFFFFEALKFTLKLL